SLLYFLNKLRMPLYKLLKLFDCRMKFFFRHDHHLYTSTPFPFNILCLRKGKVNSQSLINKILRKIVFIYPNTYIGKIVMEKGFPMTYTIKPPLNDGSCINIIGCNIFT